MKPGKNYQKKMWSGGRISKKKMNDMTTKFKNVYVVQNFGAFRDMFYYLRDARRLVREEGIDEKTGEKYYQIFKCDVELKNIKRK